MIKPSPSHRLPGLQPKTVCSILKFGAVFSALALLSACAAVSAQTSTDTDSQLAAETELSVSEAADYPLFELRTYTASPGKLDALHSRFRDHTMALFDKHGARNIAYWTPTETPNTLIYILAHESADARATTWKNFVADPEWQAVYAASIADGKLVTNIDSVLMRATDYSPNR